MYQFDSTLHEKKNRKIEEKQLDFYTHRLSSDFTLQRSIHYPHWARLARRERSLENSALQLN